MSTQPTQKSRHFHVPAEEMLFTEFDDVEVCPYYGGLTFDGVAIERHPGEADRLHLILSTDTARAYFGPDATAVARRALLLVGGLMRRADALPAERGAQVLEWITQCWESATDTVAEVAGLHTRSVR